MTVAYALRRASREAIGALPDGTVWPITCGMTGRSTKFYVCRGPKRRINSSMMRLPGWFSTVGKGVRKNSSRRSKWLGILAVLGLAACGFGLRPVSAAINVGDSIEWLCDDNPHIAIVEATLRSDVRAPQRLRTLNLPVVRTIRILKGRPPKIGRA